MAFEPQVGVNCRCDPSPTTGPLYPQSQAATRKTWGGSPGKVRLRGQEQGGEESENE